MTSTSATPRTIEYLTLEELTPDPRNPKQHAQDSIDNSIGRFGVIDLIVRDERTGHMVSGHGRWKTLTAQRDRGDDPPDGVVIDDYGDWRVPVVTGWASRSDADARAALIALNRLTEQGGWDDHALLGLLDELAGQDGGEGLTGVGFTAPEIDDLRRRLGTLEDDSLYTRKVNAPHYQVTGNCPPVETLVNTSRVEELLDNLEAAADQASSDGAPIPAEVLTFLSHAAARHAVFNFARIAEYYAHAPAPVQRLMEESALVIIDFDDAIRLGYVELSTLLDNLRELDAPPTSDDEDEDE